MKLYLKKVILLSIVLFMSGGVYLFLRLQSFDDDHISAMRIAIFEPAIHPAINEITEGFINSMKDSEQKYLFTRYNANGNKILIGSQAQEILQQEFDLVFTIGLECSMAMRGLSFKQRNHTPIVFCAIDEPVKFGLQGSNITGVVDAANYAEQLDIVLQLQPLIKKVLLIYDVSQGAGLDKDRNEIRKVLKNKKVDLQAVEINSLGEIQQKISGFMNKVDLVMILKDNTIVSGIDIIIKLCQKFKIPLLASDLNSGIKGAVLAYGIYESDSGVQGAKLAKLILEKHVKPNEIPFAIVNGMVMRINRKQAEKQGLDIDFQNISIDHVELY